MIVITEYKIINKNSLKGVFSIKIPKWGGFVIRDMAFFAKDLQKWISFPSKQYEKDGEKKYMPYNLFDDPNMSKKFQEIVINEIEQLLALKPDGLKRENNEKELF